MTHSLYKAYIRLDAGRFDADEPMDTELFRDGVVNNALHIADQNAQVRVAWCIGLVGEFDTTPLQRDSTSDAYGRITTFGYFPVNAYQEKSAKFRVRLRGASTSGSVTFRLVITRDPDLVFDYVDFTTSSSSAVWLEDDPAILEVPASRISTSVQNIGTAVAVGAASLTQVQVPLMCATVYTNSTNARLHGLYVAELAT